MAGPTLRIADGGAVVGDANRAPAGRGREHTERCLRARSKPGGIIITAMAHRANKIAFAMVRDQKTWEPSRWAA